MPDVVATDPLMPVVVRSGVPGVVSPYTGHWLPRVSGGDGPDDQAAIDEPAGDPQADPTATPPAGDPKPDALGEPGKKALDDERTARKAAEKAARDHAKQLEELQAKLADAQNSAMSEQERAVAKAVADARKEGAATATAEATQREVDLRQRLAASDLRAALTGIVPNPDDIVGDLNLARFLGEDGNPDPAAIAALRERYEAVAGPRKVPGVPAGPRGPVHEPSIDEQYRAALAAGDNKTALTLQNRKLAQFAQIPQQ